MQFFDRLFIDAVTYRVAPVDCDPGWVCLMDNQTDSLADTLTVYPIRVDSLEGDVGKQYAFKGDRTARPIVAKPRRSHCKLMLADLPQRLK